MPLQASHPSNGDTLKTSPKTTRRPIVVKTNAKGNKMTVCRFFTKGYCTKGDKCRYEHPTDHRVTASTTTDRCDLETQDLPFSPSDPSSLVTAVNEAVITLEAGAVVKEVLLRSDYASFEASLWDGRRSLPCFESGVDALRGFWRRRVTHLTPEPGKQLLLVHHDPSTQYQYDPDTNSCRFRKRFPNLKLAKRAPTTIDPEHVVSSPKSAVLITWRRPARHVSVTFRGDAGVHTPDEDMPTANEAQPCPVNLSAHERALGLQRRVTSEVRFGQNITTRLARAMAKKQCVWELDIYGLDFKIDERSLRSVFNLVTNDRVRDWSSHPATGIWDKLNIPERMKKPVEKSVKRATCWNSNKPTAGMLVEFDKIATATDSLEHLHGSHPIGPEGESAQLSADRAYIARLVSPQWLVCALRQKISQVLMVNLMEFPLSRTHRVHIHVTRLPNRMQDYSEITLWGLDQLCVTAIKAAVLGLLKGSIITHGGSPVWHHYFASAPGLKWLAKLGRTHKVVIMRQTWSDSSSHTNRLWLMGGDENLHRLAEVLNEKIGHLSGTIYRLDLTSEQLANGRSGGFRRIADQMQRRSMNLRVLRDGVFLEIKGCRADVDKAKQLLASLSPIPPAINDEECPICFCEVEDSVSGSCGHFYCRKCFTDQCQQWDVASSPIVCHGNGGSCDQPFGMDSLQKMLSGEVFHALLQSALESYVAQNIDKLRFCPTTDCDRIYRITVKPNILTCSGCYASICTKCKTPEHEDITCEENQDTNDEDRQALRRWMKSHNAKECPMEGCGAIIEKHGGCDHFQCRTCLTHFCFKCLAAFETGEQTYEHMVAAHGHIGIDDPGDGPGLILAEEAPLREWGHPHANHHNLAALQGLGLPFMPQFDIINQWAGPNFMPLGMQRRQPQGHGDGGLNEGFDRWGEGGLDNIDRDALGGLRQAAEQGHAPGNGDDALRMGAIAAEVLQNEELRNADILI